VLQNGGRRARAGALILIYSWLLQWSKRAKNCRNISASSERGGNASRSSRLCTFRLLEIETATVDHFIAMIDWFCCLSYPRLLSWGTQIDNNTGKGHPRAQTAVPLGNGLSKLLLASNWLRRDRRDERLRRVIFGELLSLSTSQLVALALPAISSW